MRVRSAGPSSPHSSRTRPAATGASARSSADDAAQSGAAANAFNVATSSASAAWLSPCS